MAIRVRRWPRLRVPLLWLQTAHQEWNVRPRGLASCFGFGRGLGGRCQNPNQRPTVPVTNSALRRGQMAMNPSRARARVPPEIPRQFLLFVFFYNSTTTTKHNNSRKLAHTPSPNELTAISLESTDLLLASAIRCCCSGHNRPPSRLLPEDVSVVVVVSSQSVVPQSCSFTFIPRTQQKPSSVGWFRVF